MQSQIYSLIKKKAQVQPVKIFGYATRGVPGLEIIGTGKLSKNIKEKIIYVTKMRSLSIPMKRFVVCLEQNDLDEGLSKQELANLEFPILMMFWYLAGFIPLSKLDDCLCAGNVDVSGIINEDVLDHHVLMSLKETLDLDKIKFISNKIMEEEGDYLVLPPKAILEKIPDLLFK